MKFPSLQNTQLRWVVAGLSVVVLISGLGLSKYLQIMAAIAYGKSFPEPAEAVIVSTAIEQTYSPTSIAIGQLEAVQQVELRVERAGVVTKVNFKSGDRVSRDQMLVEIDTSEERADLEAAKIDLDRAEAEVERDRTLYKRGNVSEAVVEQSESQVAAAKAHVSALQTAIARKTIKAPFDGNMGITNLAPGQYLDEGDLISNVVGLNAQVFVDFRLPQSAALSIVDTQPVRITTDVEQTTAKIIAREPAIDPDTRTLGFRALIENTSDSLYPGSFVKVEAVTGVPRQVVVVPRTAVARSPYGDTVYALEEKQGEVRAKALMVKLGPFVDGDNVIVESGLKAQTRIAADGVFKLHDGSLVNPVERTERFYSKAAAFENAPVTSE